MRLVTFTHNGRSRIGELVDDRVFATGWPDTMLNIIRRGISPNRIGQHFPLAEVKLEAPVRPGKIIAVGHNYTDHVSELGNTLPEGDPVIFAKFSSGIIGNGDVITWSRAITDQVDWEGELAVIIGDKARNVSEKDAYQYVFGYTICNDVTARDLQDRDGQWIRAKNMHTFCPIGPCIVTTDEIDDPHNLTLKTVVNGETMQSAHTGQMIFTIPFLIAYCSRMFLLEPGDIIITGTPSGVGKGKKPPRFLHDGDTVTVSIENIGELTNTCASVE